MATLAEQLVRLREWHIIRIIDLWFALPASSRRQASPCRAAESAAAIAARLAVATGVGG